MRPPTGLGAARAAAPPGVLAAADTDSVYASTPVRTGGRPQPAAWR
ncbi:hypothetical protein ABZ760_20185 [Streptomyces sp. NPDC006658]